MLSFDTNIAVHAANTASALHSRAYAFVAALGARRDVAVCELMLVELYLKLRNERIFAKPLGAAQAVAVCERYRSHRAWMLIDSAPVMQEVWRLSAARGFAFRRIIDARLALTLVHHGVSEFATTNVKDFQGLGFDRVWNPLATQSG
jgi:toxin-antitoxin system PIN domain toxin